MFFLTQCVNLRYLISLSGALAILNVVPCYALDGQWILMSFIELSLRSIIPDTETRSFIYTVLLLFGTLLLFTNITIAMYMLFIGWDGFVILILYYVSKRWYIWWRKIFCASKSRPLWLYVEYLWRKVVKGVVYVLVYWRLEIIVSKADVDSSISTQSKMQIASLCNWGVVWLVQRKRPCDCVQAVSDFLLQNSVSQVFVKIDDISLHIDIWHLNVQCLTYMALYILIRCNQNVQVYL